MNRRFLMMGALASACAVGPAEAKGIKVKIPRGIGLHGRPSYGPDVLKPEQLEQCLRAEKEINQSADSLDASDQWLTGKANTVEQLGKELDHGALRLDQSSQQSVDAHNAKVRRYNSLANEFDTEAKAFNTRVRLHNSSIDQFNANCANKKYYESDMKAAREKVGS